MNQPKKFIWILEDDLESQEIYRSIIDNIAEISFFKSIHEFEAALKSALPRPSLLIADLKLPDGNFIDLLCKKDSESKIRFPLIVASSLDDEEMLDASFREGAIDYLVKPFRKNEGKIKILRHLNAPDTQSDAFGYKLDTFRHGLTYRDELVVGLTPKEQQIFVVLQKHLDDGISKHGIVSEAWQGSTIYEKSFDVHLFNLRRKFKDSTNLEITQNENGKYKIQLSNRVNKPRL